MLITAFPSFKEGITPMAAAYGLSALTLPSSMDAMWLSTPELAELALLSVLAPIENNPNAHICVSFDAEWNISRNVGVSIIQIAPHNIPDTIFIIPVRLVIFNTSKVCLIFNLKVHAFGGKLPPSLLRLLVSPQVFKIGSNIKGDLTRMRKQFHQLSEQFTFNVIDLRQYCIDRGFITRKDTGSLDALCAKVLRVYLGKPDHVRKHDGWETKTLSSDLLNYACLDVFASRLIFEKASQVSPLTRPSFDSPSGTRIALLLQEGGDIIAYGKIADSQPASFDTVRVKTPYRNRLLLDIDEVLNPAAAAILHLSSKPPTKIPPTGKTKSGALTLGELQQLSPTMPFQMVAPVSLLDYDNREVCTFVYFFYCAIC